MMSAHQRRGAAPKAPLAAALLVGALIAADGASAQQAEVQGGRRAAGGPARVARDAPLINRVAFEGNKKITKESLETAVQTRARLPVNQATVDADAERIREAYRRGGRGLATVTPRIVDLPNGRVDVVFTIDEGDKTGVRELRFQGNRVYSDSRLRDLMSTTEMNLLSFLKNSDVYDPDRIAADQEVIRRYYLKNGYADFRFVSTNVQFDREGGGYIVTMTVEEGEQYRIGSVQLDSRLTNVDPEVLRERVQTAAGDVYNAEAVERTLTDVTTEAARRGNGFAQVRPVGQRDPATRTIALGYVVEEGPRVYIERINVRGNTRTRDYVIRRELDLGEGDAYNRVLVERGERRLNNLGYFKKVRISNEPGSAPDRVVVNIDVEDQPTGAFSVAGGYSTADGFIGEVSVTESNFLGRGQYVRVAGTYGEYSRGIDLSFTEPYFLGYRLAAGVDLFSKFSDQTRYARYENQVTGFQLRLGLPITEEFGVTLRYSFFAQDLSIPNTVKRPYNDCSSPIPGVTEVNAGTGNPRIDGLPNRFSCESNGEASIAIKQAQGTTLTSLAGLTLGYSTLDSRLSPRNGLVVELKPDVAGLGGDSHYFRISGDARYYKELFFDDVVGIARIQGGHIEALNGGNLRLVDQFFLGPSLVRGFAPSGIGPRDITTLDTTGSALGGTTYAGASLEVQFPIYGIPRDLGLKGAVFADAGTLFGYRAGRTFDINGDAIINGFGPAGCIGSPLVQAECVNVRDKDTIRSSVGASILWNSPLGPIRFDYAVATSKDEGIRNAAGVRVGGDQTQAFRFSGGSRF